VNVHSFGNSSCSRSKPYARYICLANLIQLECVFEMVPHLCLLLWETEEMVRIELGSEFEGITTVGMELAGANMVEQGTYIIEWMIWIWCFISWKEGREGVGGGVFGEGMCE
jgi:hypothetical protein